MRILIKFWKDILRQCEDILMKFIQNFTKLLKILKEKIQKLYKIMEKFLICGNNISKIPFWDFIFLKYFPNFKKIRVEKILFGKKFTKYSHFF